MNYEGAPVLLNVYDSWGKLGTVGVTSRTGIISVIYIKGDKKRYKGGKLQTHILQFLTLFRILLTLLVFPLYLLQVLKLAPKTF